MSFHLLKAIPIQVYSKGETIVNTRSWSLGHWKYSENRPAVWGLLYMGYPTQMCYGIDYAVPKECIAKLDSYDPPESDWYFDAGAKLTVKKEDLKLGFEELGIWD